MTSTEIKNKLKALDRRICCANNNISWLTDDIKEALVNSPDLDGTNYVVSLEILQNAIDGVGIGTNINTIDIYSNLPAANVNSGIFYWVESDEGTWWLPGSLGGTYYKKGLYYSNGVIWETAPVPYQATQLEVDAGVEAYKFVTPLTLQGKIDDLKYSVTLPSTLTYTVLQATHGLSNVSGINLYTPSGQSVITEYTVIANDVTVYSNVDLLNHILKIY